WWSHAGWILTGEAMHHDTSILQKYVPDLGKDDFHLMLTKFHWVPQVILGLMLASYGFFTGGIMTGVAYVLWRIFLPVSSRLRLAKIAQPVIVPTQEEEDSMSPAEAAMVASAGYD